MANLAMTAGRMESGGVCDLKDAEALATASLLIEKHYRISAEAAGPDAASGPCAAVQHFRQVFFARTSMRMPHGGTSRHADSFALPSMTI
jgi:hypothetical protein